MNNENSPNNLARVINEIITGNMSRAYQLKLGNKKLEQQVLQSIAKEPERVWPIIYYHLRKLDETEEQLSQSERNVMELYRQFTDLQEQVLQSSRWREQFSRNAANTDATLESLRVQVAQIYAVVVSDAQTKLQQANAQLQDYKTKYEKLGQDCATLKEKNDQLLSTLTKSTRTHNDAQVGEVRADEIAGRFRTYRDHTVHTACNQLLNEGLNVPKLKTDAEERRRATAILTQLLYTDVLVECYSLTLQERYSKLLNKALQVGATYPLPPEVKRRIIESIADQALPQVSLPVQTPASLHVVSEADTVGAAGEVTIAVAKEAANEAETETVITPTPEAGDAFNPLAVAMAGRLMSRLAEELAEPLAYSTAPPRLLEILEQFLQASNEMVAHLLAFEDPIELYFPAAGEKYDAKLHHIHLDEQGNRGVILRTVRPGLRFHGDCLLTAEVVV